MRFHGALTPSDCKTSAGEDDGGYSEVHVRKKKKRCSALQWRRKNGEMQWKKNGETFVVTVLSDTWCTALSDRCRLHRTLPVHPSSGSWWGWGGLLCTHRSEFPRWWWGWCLLHNVNAGDECIVLFGVLCLVKDKFSIYDCICIQASIFICISISISICICGDELSVSDTTGSVWQRAPQDKQGNRGKRTFRSFLHLFPRSLHRRTMLDAKDHFSTVLPLTL